MFEKKTIRYTGRKTVTTQKRVYDKETKQHIIVKEKKLREMKETNDIGESRAVMMKLMRRFASYIKHKERGKKDRRAICSTGMFLRMFLKIIEYFHLKLAKDVKGSTISIGGEEKKMKIAFHLTVKNLATTVAGSVAQGTEDATKWNKCLAPATFALMHTYLFDDEVRKRARVLPRSGESFSRR